MKEHISGYGDSYLEIKLNSVIRCSFSSNICFANFRHVIYFALFPFFTEKDDNFFSSFVRLKRSSLRDAEKS